MLHIHSLIILGVFSSLDHQSQLSSWKSSTHFKSGCRAIGCHKFGKCIESLSCPSLTGRKWSVCLMHQSSCHRTLHQCHAIGMPCSPYLWQLFCPSFPLRLHPAACVPWHKVQDTFQTGMLDIECNCVTGLHPLPQNNVHQLNAVVKCLSLYVGKNPQRFKQTLAQVLEQFRWMLRPGAEIPRNAWNHLLVWMNSLTASDLTFILPGVQSDSFQGTGIRLCSQSSVAEQLNQVS